MITMFYMTKHALSFPNTFVSYTVHTTMQKWTQKYRPTDNFRESWRGELLRSNSFSTHLSVRELKDGNVWYYGRPSSCITGKCSKLTAQPQSFFLLSHPLLPFVPPSLYTAT